MVLINYAQQTVNLKIVYWGPAESGKTSNLKYICQNISSSLRSDLSSIEGEGQQTLLFDHMSLNAGEIKGFNTTLNLFSTAGKNNISEFKDIVLKDADGIIFVADSQTERLQENIQSFEELEVFLSGQERKIPVIIQYNKRDLGNAASLEELEKFLNKRNYPAYEVSASKGSGVFACLKSISNLILTNLQ